MQVVTLVLQFGLWVFAGDARAQTYSPKGPLGPPLHWDCAQAPHGRSEHHSCAHDRLPALCRRGLRLSALASMAVVPLTWPHTCMGTPALSVCNPLTAGRLAIWSMRRSQTLPSRCWQGSTAFIRCLQRLFLALPWALLMSLKAMISFSLMRTPRAG